MNRFWRYVLFAMIFTLVLLGLLSRSAFALLLFLAFAVGVGLLSDRLDNRRDEPFKKYNYKHHHLHRHS